MTMKKIIAILKAWFLVNRKAGDWMEGRSEPVVAQASPAGKSRAIPKYEPDAEFDELSKLCP